MRKYELTYLISDEVAESDLNKTTGKVAGLISELGGKVDKEDIWGRRKLAYPIQKQDFATYVTLNFSLPAEKAQEFEKDLRHIGNIMRQLMIVKEYGHEELTLTAAEVAATADIKSVVGGKKSFEAIEGETEESKELMAKRSAEVEEPHFAEASRGADAEENPAKAEEETAEEQPIEPEKEAEPVETIKKKPEAEETAEKEKEKTEKKPAEKPKKAAKKEKSSDEAERLSKLNEELDDILKDEL